MTKQYAVYNQDDELVAVGTSKECCEFMGITMQGFRQKLHRRVAGKLKGRQLKYYDIYEIEKGEEDE